MELARGIAILDRRPPGRILILEPISFLLFAGFWLISIGILFFLDDPEAPLDDLVQLRLEAEEVVVVAHLDDFLVSTFEDLDVLQDQVFVVEAQLKLRLLELGREDVPLHPLQELDMRHGHVEETVIHVFIDYSRLIEDRRGLFS